MILVVGESLVDVVERSDGTRHEHPGGSPANVAVGLGRLGVPVRLLTDLGDDAHGALVADHLRASGVALVRPLTRGRRTCTSVARIGPDGAATYEFDLRWGPGPMDEVTTPAALHLGSIGAFMVPGADDLEALARRLAPSCAVSYDPNVRPSLVRDRDETLSRIERLVALSHLVKLSDEDAAWIAPGRDLAGLARDWLTRGARAVIVTRGAEGAVVAAHDGVREIAAPPAQVTDTVGAGDSFMAGLLAALHGAGVLTTSGLASLGVDDLAGAARFAARASAVTVGRAGADPPWAHEISRV